MDWRKGEEYSSERRRSRFKTQLDSRGQPLWYFLVFNPHVKLERENGKREGMEESASMEQKERLGV
ncbi:hypothetical protein [Halobacillus karajensis]|uniref:hypothetical protein n=1 Tax=Halobacillus karajensis TaxID=195088 RepID=UPI000555257E|nr:hypothetical protein [Halobacillus karajensis]